MGVNFQFSVYRKDAFAPGLVLFTMKTKRGAITRLPNKIYQQLTIASAVAFSSAFGIIVINATLVLFDIAIQFTKLKV